MSTPLFSIDNISPGFIEKQSIKIANSQNEGCDLSLNLKNISSFKKTFSEKILIQISTDQKIIFNGNLNYLFNKNLELDYLKANSEKEYIWTASLNKDIGNEFQNSSTKFNIKFNLLCNDQSKILGAYSHYNPYLFFFFFFFSLLGLIISILIFIKQSKTR
ncbi:MAG: hypothetical protein WCG91_01005 [Candidatus Shapirobacteria bacterium]